MPTPEQVEDQAGFQALVPAVVPLHAGLAQLYLQLKQQADRGEATTEQQVREDRQREHLQSPSLECSLGLPVADEQTNGLPDAESPCLQCLLLSVVFFDLLSMCICAGA